MSAQTDELGAAIVAAALAPNECLLDMNGTLSVPHGFALPAPWNLPSRLFQFPIEVIKPEGEEPRKIGLRNPGLAAHPFVQHVEKTLGIEIAREGVTNAYGYSDREKAAWWHAVDLISEGNWRELLDTQEFTTARCIFQAVIYGCRYSGRDDNNGRGHINTVEAREIMREMGACEPADRSGTIRKFSAPMGNKQDGGAEHWPINTAHGVCAEDNAWAIIHGIEDGWFAHDRSGFLQWSQVGRDRYAAGESVSFTEASGQAAFAF